MPFFDFLSKSVPILMFHGVSDTPERYHKPELVCATSLFEAFLEKLKLAGFTSITLRELYDFKRGAGRLPRNPIILTFDDGFLDNYVFAAPLLKKYGYTGTLFAIQDFVEKNEKRRPTLEDYWKGNIARKELPTLGYCSIAELQDLDRSGVLEVNAHSATHTWHFKSDRLAGIYKQTEYQKWLEWNHRPEIKPYQMTEEEREIPFGYPVFEFAPTLSVERVYFPDPLAVQAIIEEVENTRGALTSERIQDLQELVRQYPGRYETDQERDARYRRELVEAKHWLEEILDRNVDFFAWPNGAYNKLTWQLAAGQYLAFPRPSAKITNTRKDPVQEFYRLGAPGGGTNRKDAAAKRQKLYYKVRVAGRNFLYYIPFASFVAFEKLGLIKLERPPRNPIHRYDFKVAGKQWETVRERTD